MRWKELRKFLDSKFTDQDRISIIIEPNCNQVLIIKNEVDITDDRIILIKLDGNPDESFNGRLDKYFLKTKTPFNKPEMYNNIICYTEGEISKYFK